MELIRHRGPDGAAIWTGKALYNDNITDAAVCHSHLRVTGGMTQPVPINDGALSYNGEIYNFRDFAPGDSDTLALASIIRDTGIEGFIRLAPLINGDYAFAVAGKSGIMLARDPVGIKPLYYGESADGFGFASEPKALKAAGINNIFRLPPGHVYNNGRIIDTIALPAYMPEIMDEIVASAKLEEALSGAVAIRTHKNAAVAFSGGLDCSLVAAMAGETPLYTVGLKDSYDVKAAKHAAKLMGAKNHHVYEMAEKDVEAALPEVIYALESADPMKVSIGTPTWLLAREARRSGFKVLLSGQGADELFGGYARYEEASRKGTLADSLQHDLRSIAEVNLERDDAVTMAHGVEMRVPYLDMRVIGVSQRIDTSLKVRYDGKDYIRKYILRKMADKYLPHEVAYAAKKAIQYGTGVGRTLERLSRDNGYKNDLTGYLNSLYEVVF